MAEAHDLAARFYEHFAVGDFDAAVDLFAPECVHVGPAGEMATPDWRVFSEAFKRALPDAHMEIIAAVEGGDAVAIEGRFRGTHTAPLATPQGEIPASGNAIDVPFADFFRVADGRIVEHRVYWDQLGMLAQLGATPAPG